MTVGLPVLQHGFVDFRTGLCWRNLGCAIDDKILSYLEGYNDTIERAFLLGELKGMSFKAKIMAKKEVLKASLKGGRLRDRRCHFSI